MPGLYSPQAGTILSHGCFITLFCPLGRFTPHLWASVSLSVQWNGWTYPVWAVEVLTRCCLELKGLIHFFFLWVWMSLKCSPGSASEMPTLLQAWTTKSRVSLTRKWDKEVRQIITRGTPPWNGEGCRNTEDRACVCRPGNRDDRHRTQEKEKDAREAGASDGEGEWMAGTWPLICFHCPGVLGGLLKGEHEGMLLSWILPSFPPRWAGVPVPRPWGLGDLGELPGNPPLEFQGGPGMQANGLRKA